MKPMLLCLGLILPASCLAAAGPQQHEDVAFAAPPVRAPEQRHHPLFEVRYVLVRATPSRPPPASPGPAVDLGDGKAAIHPLPLEGPGVVSVAGRFRNPNMLLCRSWGCRRMPGR